MTQVESDILISILFSYTPSISIPATAESQLSLPPYQCHATKVRHRSFMSVHVLRRLDAYQRSYQTIDTLASRNRHSFPSLADPRSDSTEGTTFAIWKLQSSQLAHQEICIPASCLRTRTQVNLSQMMVTAPQIPSPDEPHAQSAPKHHEDHSRFHFEN